MIQLVEILQNLKAMVTSGRSGAGAQLAMSEDMRI